MEAVDEKYNESDENNEEGEINKSQSKNITPRLIKIIENKSNFSTSSTRESADFLNSSKNEYNYQNCNLNSGKLLSKY